MKTRNASLLAGMALLAISPTTTTHAEAFGDGSGPIGSQFCFGPVFSFTGGMSAFGSETVADNNVTLTALGLPTNAMGYFLVGETQGFVANPAGSQGDLCLGGKLGRFNRASQIRNSGSAGQYSLTLDLNDFPMNPTQSVFAGETWHFQSWYRLPAGVAGGNSDSDFTTAISITFN